MAFSFGNSGNNSMLGGSSGAGGATQGPDLEVIQTEGLGFLSLAGDAKVQLTSRWTDLPAPTASLISIASRKGLVAAAGPDAIHLASTESVRKALEAEKSGGSDVRPFQPQVKVPLPIRISQLAFTADEQLLLLSAETGGGLAVYDVQSLSQGSTQAAFELSTNGETLRALLPNPAAEKAELCAVVTSNGNLMMANLKDKSLVHGPRGASLKSGVSCAAWSSKGKQLVAGLADGTIQQMTPEGKETGQIPKPPGLGDYHVASLVWLENDVFLAIYNNAASGQDPSVYHIINRHKQGNQPPSFTFQKLTDPVEPFGSDKVPHHSVLRLRDFPPSLPDLLLVSSTATESIGLLSRSKTPLTSNAPADKITNVFTTTEFADDAKRAQLPMSEELAETFPIGTALDLSGKDKVYKPIPTDEMDSSPGPLPGLWALNNEGVLSCWWIVYNESIREGTTYPGMAAVVGEGDATPKPAAAPTTPAAPTTFGTPSTAAPSFGSPSTTSSTAFGASSALGAKKPSPWGSTPASSNTSGTAAPTTTFGSSSFGSGPLSAAPPSFGTPSFETPSAMGGSKPAAPAFGQSSTMGSSLGMRASPWGGTASAKPAAPSFGHSGFGQAAAQSPGSVFGSSSSNNNTTGASSNAPASGGFASFASKGGFGSLAQGSTSGGSSIFGPSKPLAPFQSSAASPEVSMDSDTAFPPPAAAKTSGSSPFAFVLGTTFKADPATANDNEKPKERGGSLFGPGFGLSLGDEPEQKPAETEPKDEDMDTTPTAAGGQNKTKSIFGSQESTTPTTTPAPSKFFGATSPPPGMSIFGRGPSSTSGGFGGLFGRPSVTTTSPDSSEKEKKAQQTGPNPFKRMDAPLPPESTSKAAYPVGDSSSSSAASGISPQFLTRTPTKGPPNDVALPPGFLARPAKEEPEEAAPRPPDFLVDKGKPKSSSAPEEAPLPPDFVSRGKPSAAAGEGPPLPPDFLPKLVPPAPSESDSLEEGEIDDGEDEGSAEEEQEEDEEEEEEEDEQEQEDAEHEDEDGDEEDQASEGSGIDVANDLSPTTTTTTTMNFGGHTPGLTPQSSFGGMGGSAFSITSRPADQEPQRRLFGELSRNAPVLFSQPAQPTSPRSPSPVRNAFASRMLGPDAMRSVSAPGMASQMLGNARKPLPVPVPVPVPGMKQSIGFAEDPNVLMQRRAQAKKEAEETQLLVDDEDVARQRELQQETEPTREVAEFLIPHAADGVGETGTIPAQVEALYRDINRMVDTAGLNSRALQAFVKGQAEFSRNGGRSKEDLEREDDWVLCEIEDCWEILDHELAGELENARLRDPDDVLASLCDLHRDMSRLRAKAEDLKRNIMSQIDPDQAALARSLPLSAEQATQQNDLRKVFAKFSRLLSESEEALSMLKARVASAGGAAGSKGSSATVLPTVDAVMRTITKMTSMVEKRSGDVDVLENQMRKLRLGAVGVGSPRSREEGSPLASTPQHHRHHKSSSLIFSPDHGKRGSISLTSSMASYGGGGMRATPPRRKMSGYSDAEKKEIRQKRDRKKGVLEMLKTSLEKAGPNVWRMTDEDV